MRPAVSIGGNHTPASGILAESAIISKLLAESAGHKEKKEMSLRLCIYKGRQMGQKDLAAKQFERSPEVFADIVNALIFEGKQVVFPKDLQPAPTESLYQAADGALRSQYNDVSKYEMKQGRIVVQYTLENQSGPDYRIVLRKAGYEGAIYRQQYDGDEAYPVITLVLYWGDRVWNTDVDLYHFFRKKRIHGMVRKYIDNVRVHVYPMKRLSEQVRQRFQGDMKIVVDYLAEGKKYEPTDQKIADVAGTMRMLHALTGEISFINNMEKLEAVQKRGGRVTMCEVVDKFVQRGRAQGIEEGIKEEKKRCATAFVRETVMQKQSREYIMGILQTCFQLKEEEADNLYREGYEREHGKELPVFT